jgi:hypothetical protein
MDTNIRCTLQGTLRGIICVRLNVFDLVADAEIIAVLSERKEASAAGLPGREEAQSLKSVLRRVEPQELEAAIRGERLVLRGKTGEDGSFCLVEQRFEKGLLDVYAVITSVPLHGREARQVPLREKQVLYLGTYDLRDGSHLDVTIPQPVWCRIKRAADVWTIAGRVSACDDRSVAIGDVKVTAFDVDWLQDDNLGTDTTSSAGIFRIDYLGEKYRKGTFIDVELFGGPDVYFRIEDADGNPLLVEDPQEGRKPGRANSGPCLCVELCVKIPVPGPQPGYSLWTSVGSFNIPDASGLNDFDADGYAGAARYGFTRKIHLSGTTAPNTQYRFLVSDVTTANGAAPPAAGNFTRIVGVSPNDNLFTTFHIGDYYRISPFKILKIFAKEADLDAQGWLDVNAAINRTFTENPALDRSTFNFYVPTGRLALLDTAPLTHQPDVPDGAALPGQPVPAANLIAIEKVAVRFEVRDATSHAALPGSGTTLNSMVVNNNPAFLKLAMTEHLTSNPCAILHGDIHIAYTGYHPHLEAMSISVQSNSGAYSVNMQDPLPPPPPPPLHLPLSGNTNPAFVQLSNPALALPNSPPNVLVKCTYLVQLFLTRRLFTSSEDADGALYQSPVGTDSAWTTFYYEP